jgi:hypothetical protein
MWLRLAPMTLASSMVLVDQTAVPPASPDVVGPGPGTHSGVTKRPPPPDRT